MGGENSTTQPTVESEAVIATATEQSSSDVVQTQVETFKHNIVLQNESILLQPDAGALTSMLAQLLTNPNNPQIQQLTGLLSSSQQAQLQSFVSQVKGQQEVS